MTILNAVSQQSAVSTDVNVEQYALQQQLSVMSVGLCEEMGFNPALNCPRLIESVMSVGLCEEMGFNPSLNCPRLIESVMSVGL